MKKLINYLLLIVLFITSCNSEKRLQRAINKHGQKESATYFVSYYPEYFKVESSIVDTTIIIHDTILVKGGISIDTIFISPKDGTDVAFENEFLKMEILNLNGKLQLKGKCKDRIITKIDTISIIVPCPEIICPDIPQVINNKKKSWLSELIISISFNLFMCLLVLYYLISKIRK